MYWTDLQLVSYKTIFLLALALARGSVSYLPCRLVLLVLVSRRFRPPLSWSPGFMAYYESPLLHPEPILLGRLTDFAVDA